MMIIFKDIFHIKSSKDEATSNIIFQYILSSVSLSNVGIYLGHGPFTSDVGKVNLSPTKGTFSDR